MSTSSRATSRMTLKRLAIFGIAFGALNLYCVPLANADNVQSSGTAADDRHAGYKQSGLKIETDDSVKGKDVVLTLCYIRDCALAVNELREQALNIFAECTRKRLTPADPMFSTLQTVSEADIDVNAKYHKPRPPWIFFYIATFEPILQLFRSATMTEDAPVSTGKLIVPASMAVSAKEGLGKLDTMIASIDTQIERLNTLLDNDSENSVEMAKAAVSIFKTTEELKAMVEASYKALQESELKGEKETVGVE